MFFFSLSACIELVCRTVIWLEHDAVFDEHQWRFYSSLCDNYPTEIHSKQWIFICMGLTMLILLGKDGVIFGFQIDNVLMDYTYISKVS